MWKIGYNRQVQISGYVRYHSQNSNGSYIRTIVTSQPLPQCDAAVQSAILKPRKHLTTVSKLEITNPWAPYGLSEDPYFQQALEPFGERWPMSLFVGRNPEVQLLGNQIVGSSSSRAIVQGAAGVGKTSFVNRLKVVLAEHNVLTHQAPVRVERAMTPRRFVAAVLKVLNQMRAAMATTTDNAVVGAAKSRLAHAPTLSKEARFWQKIGRIVDGEDSIAGGVNVLGVGAQHERIRIPPEVSEMPLDEELRQAIEYLSSRGRRRVLIHVNNLENLSPADVGAAAVLMRDVRDCLLTDHSHWLFVGTTGIADEVFGQSAQVRGIIPHTITLDALSRNDVELLLNRRYEHLQRGRKLVPPVSADAAAELYARYDGQLRDFLRLLSGGVQRQAGLAPGVPLSAEQIVNLMAPRYFAEQLVAKIGDGDAEHLATIYRDQKLHGTFRVTDAAHALAITQASASKFVQRLLAAGIIVQASSAGRNIYYRLASGDNTIALALQAE